MRFHAFQMRYHGHIVEVIEPGTKIGEMRRCRVAIDGTPSVPFEVHEADFLKYPTETLRIQMFARQAMGLIEQFGDGRCPRPVFAGALQG